MKENLTQFQVILLAIFGFFIVAGVLFFALYRGGGGQDLPPLTLWGTFPKAMMDRFLLSAPFQGQPIKFTYVEKDEVTLDEEFTKALADGVGPDLLLLPQNLILKEQSRLVVIDPKVLSERDFKDTFIEGAELYLGNNGAIGVPFSVDPLLMYWNRTLFSNASIALAPQTWDQFAGLVPKLSEYDQAGNIRKSAVALGSFQNITNAKEILATLFLQAGNEIVGIRDGKYEAVLKESSGSGTPPAEAALAFYTGFGDAAKSNYSWNRALPISSRAFVDGTLATYFGFASELTQIRAKNPNLNFDVASLPQLKKATVKLTYGKFTAAVIPRQTKNTEASLNGALFLASSAVQSGFTETSGLPPVRRDLLGVATPKQDYVDVFYQSALISHSWRDPNPVQSANVFKDMIQSVTSGSESVASAVSQATTELHDIILGK